MEPPALWDKRPSSQQRSPFWPSFPLRQLLRQGGSLAAAALSAWMTRWAGRREMLPKKPKLFPSHNTEKDVGPGLGMTETCWFLLWAQDSVHRAAIVNTLQVEKISRRPKTTSALDLSAEHLHSFPFPGPLSLVPSQRQSSLCLLCFKDYPKHHCWLTAFLQSGHHKADGPHKYMGVQQGGRGSVCCWCARSAPNLWETSRKKALDFCVIIVFSYRQHQGYVFPQM